MVNCPLCEAGIDVDEEELDEGDSLLCEECGTELTVTGLSPLELSADGELDDDDEDEEDDDEEEDDDFEDEESDEDEDDFDDEEDDDFGDLGEEDEDDDF